MTILGKIGETRFRMFYYKYPVLKPFIEFDCIKIAHSEDIAAMKMHAIEMRGTRRDFVDVYFLAKDFSVEQMLNFYDKKYSSLDTHLYSIIRALNYFEDAEQESQMPKMTEAIDWETIKYFFEKEARRISEKHIDEL